MFPPGTPDTAILCHINLDQRIVQVSRGQVDRDRRAAIERLGDVDTMAVLDVNRCAKVPYFVRRWSPYRSKRGTREYGAEQKERRQFNHAVIPPVSG